MEPGVKKEVMFGEAQGFLNVSLLQNIPNQISLTLTLASPFADFIDASRE